MKITKLKIGMMAVLMLTIAFSAQFVGARSANAVDGESNAPVTTTSLKNTRETGSDEVKAAVSNKLEAIKLKVCQKRELIIRNVMTRMSDRGDKQMQVFDKIAEKVKTFYVEKKYSVANYDELVAAVNDARSALVTVNQNNAISGENFACDSSDPRGSITEFKGSETARIQAMKTYKTAIQKLIVAVKSVTPVAAADATKEANN